MNEQEKKVKIPDGMLNAAWKAVGQKMMERDALGKSDSIPELHVARIAMEAALLWSSENPIVPTEEQARELVGNGDPYEWPLVQKACVEWQRRMLFAPQPDDSEIKDLLDPQKCPHRWARKDDDSIQEHVVYCELCGWVYSRTAYQRGLNKRNSK